MPQGASYPSPNSTQMGEGPFYTSQHQMPVSEDLQTPTQSAHRGPPNTEQFDRGDDDGLEAGHRAQDLRHSQLASPQQLAQSGLESTQLYHNNTADSASRKRTKVSRACDECRRKKIKCDAVSEAAGVQCSGCRRADASCLFSRTPQKRGPSKGYIKELADRVGALEGRRPVAPMAGYHYNAYNEYSPQPDDVGFGPRKRTHSMSEGLQNSPYMQDQIQDSVGRYSGAGSMDWSNREIVQHALTRDANFSMNIPNEQTLQENPSTPSLRQENQQTALEQSEVLSNKPSTESELQAVELRDDAVDEYYRVVHATFPLFPDTKAQMVNYFGKASPIVRKAFSSALSYLAKVTSSASSAAPNGPEGRVAHYQIAIQAELFDSWTQYDNVLYLQTLVLMILATDIYPRSPCRISVWYGLAFTVSTFLQLHVKKDAEAVANANMTSIDIIARKSWLVLVVLDRWHAAGASYPPTISDRGICLSLTDRALLGDQLYHLTRLSLTLGSVVDSVSYVETPMGVNSISGRRISDGLHMGLERLRESIEPLFPASPLMRLAYLHVKLLTEWYWAEDQAGSEDINGMASEVVDLLCAAQYPTNPMIPHFASLAAIILKESLRYPANEVAFRKLDELRVWVEKGGKLGWEAALLQFLTGASLQNQRHSHDILPADQTSINRGGLQFLANAAVGEPSSPGIAREEVVGAPSHDTSNPPLRKLMGYLNVIKRSWHD